MCTCLHYAQANQGGCPLSCGPQSILEPAEECKCELILYEQREELNPYWCTVTHVCKFWLNPEQNGNESRISFRERRPSKWHNQSKSLVSFSKLQSAWQSRPYMVYWALKTQDSNSCNARLKVSEWQFTNQCVTSIMLGHDWTGVDQLIDCHWHSCSEAEGQLFRDLKSKMWEPEQKKSSRAWPSLYFQ